MYVCACTRPRARVPTCTHAHARRQIRNIYCFSTATVVSWTRLIVTLYVHCLSCLTLQSHLLLTSPYKASKLWCKISAIPPFQVLAIMLSRSYHRLVHPKANHQYRSLEAWTGGTQLRTRAMKSRVTLEWGRHKWTADVIGLMHDKTQNNPNINN
jgi:hypothetical protein